jgi:DNA-binding transcriptional LysR family regulator
MAFGATRHFANRNNLPFENPNGVPMDRLMSMRVFERVIDEGGFAAAARALDMSPAVVTRLVADLEDHLGTRLLHRSTRRLSLSDAGEAYLSRVRAILQDVDEAHQLASAHTQELAGELRVLAPPLLATHLLGPVVAGFLQRYPKIVLDIDVATHRDPAIEDYDVTLLVVDADFDANLIARKIATSEIILVASPAYLQRRGTPAVPADLVQHDNLRVKHGNLADDDMQLLPEDPALEPASVRLKPVLRANHADALLYAALSGAGIMLIAFEVVVTQLARGELVRVLPGWTVGQFSIYAALPSRKFLPQRTQVFLDYLSEQTKALKAAALANCPHARQTRLSAPEPVKPRKRALPQPATTSL